MYTSTFPTPQRSFLWQELFAALNEQMCGFDATGLNQQMFGCKRQRLFCCRKVYFCCFKVNIAPVFAECYPKEMASLQIFIHVCYSLAADKTAEVYDS